MNNTVEGDVSILIPTYKYADLIEGAVKSALATGAGEIIVSDDASNDNTIRRLARFRDSRLRFVDQPDNLGLWQNHLAVLGLASLPWVKFLQADDLLTPGALQRMVKHVSPSISLVWSNPTFRSYATNAQWSRYTLGAPLLLSSQQVFECMSKVGLFFGTPSHMLIRKVAFDFSPQAWANDISADVIMGIQAAAHGAVVCLPEGNVIHGIHPRQDGQTQSFNLSFRRLHNTIKYLLSLTDPELQRFLPPYVAVEVLGWLRNSAGQIRRRRPLYSGFWGDLVHLISLVPYRDLVRRPGTAVQMYRAKYAKGTIPLPSPMGHSVSRP